MRPTRTFLVLLTLLCGCGGVSIIFKSPVSGRCEAAGLQGCPEMTEGVLLYIEGNEAEGKDKIERGAAQNAPAKVKKFAKAIKELNRIPGAAKYVKPLMAVADILASAKGGKGAPGQPGQPGDDEPGPGPGAPPGPVDDGTGIRDGGTVVPATARDRFPCGGLSGVGYCVRVAPGPLVLTELTTGPGCSAEMAVGAVKTGDGLDIPRWVARNPRGPTDARAVVRRGETLFVGVQTAAANDPRCTLTWAGTRPYNGR